MTLSRRTSWIHSRRAALPSMLLAVIAALLSTNAPGAGEAADPLGPASAALAAGDFETAASAFAAIARADAANGAAWLGLGQTLHGQGKWSEAIDAFEKAEALQFAPPRTR